MGASEPSHGRKSRRNAFTILELLVSVAVFSLMLVMIASIVSQTGSIWRGATRNLGSFQSARQAFDILTRSIGDATLNTYWDYQIAAGQAVRYRRHSDLHFLVGPAGEGGLPGTENCGQAVFFQALLGKNSTSPGSPGASQFLNEVGFYVKYGSDSDDLPSLLRNRLTERHRYRLYQTISPTENCDIYTQSGAAAWIDTADAQPIADNIIALVLAPRRAPAEETARGPLVTDLRYDSRESSTADPQPVTAHQVPPFLEVYLVAIDEASAARLDSGAAQPSVIAQALSGKFTLLADLSSDLEDLTAELTAKGVQSRIFSTRIPMRESKWSEY